MVTSRNIIILLVACLLGSALFFFLHSTQEEQIRARLDQLCKEMQKQENEPALDSMTRAARIGKIFRDPCTIYFTSPLVEGTLSRREIIQHISMARNAFTRLNLTFFDITFNFPDDRLANLFMTMRVQGYLQGNDEPFSDVRELRMDMKQTDGTWHISRVEEVQVLER